MTTELATAATDAPPGATALTVEGVVAGYGDTTVLRDVHLELPRGWAGAMVGPNGAGKSTLLGVVSGLVRAREGHVRMSGDDITALAPHHRQQRGLCHVPEGRGIFPSLTTRENLVLLAPRGREKEAVEEAVAAFPSLGRRIDLPAGRMSGGERQMLAVARAYVSSPDLLLLDEVSLGLAPVIIDDIYVFLQRIREEGTTMLIVEQFVERALELADVVWVMTKGRLSQPHDPEDLDADAIGAMYLGR